MQIEPNHRVVHVHAGGYDLRKELPSVVDEFTAGVRRHLDGEVPRRRAARQLLAEQSRTELKHGTTCPRSRSRSTLARVKAEGGDPEPDRRVEAEDRIIRCAGAISVNCDEEERQFRRLYGDPPGRIEVVAPAVEHAFFAPATGAARRALDLAADRWCCSSAGSSR
ncbi:MAG: hypothetical protein R2713_11485 [Ilumatobacteraceae bacterium]